MKPDLVLKGGMIAWAQVGDANASIPTPQPVLPRPMYGAAPRIAAERSLAHLAPAALDAGLADRLELTRRMVACGDVRSVTKADLPNNDACPDIAVDPDTFAVRIDGRPAPAEHLRADADYSARVAAPAVRDASRALGRHLLRMAVRVWPSDALDGLARSGRAPAGGPGWHHPVVLGVVAGSRQASERDAATVALYGLVSAIGSAGVRLLGLDPVEVHGVQARLAHDLDRLALAAVDAAQLPFAELPATSTPLVDVRAQRHAEAATGRLFAS